MVTLSLAMIVKNEEETIERVLSSAKQFCDELVVADTGSTDRTVELAKAMGAKVVHFDWIDHFAAARNCAFEHATGDWIMWLDADDVVSEEDQAKIIALKNNGLHEGIDGVLLTYQYAFNSENVCTFSFLRERIIRREAGLKWEYPVHECIALGQGKGLVRKDINIQHKPLPEKQPAKKDRNIKILRHAVESGDCSPRNMFYFGNELRDHHEFEEALKIYKQYVEISNLDWEKYSAMMSMVRCCFNLGREAEAVEWCTKALLHDSRRAEAFNQLGVYFYNKKQWQKAMPFFTAAITLKKPENGFVNEADYSWVPYDYLSICYDRIGDYEKSIEMIMKALPNNPDKSRLLKNMHWLVDQL
jgi:glycosyltransferase involved in cell wall biosynthesis